MALHAAEMAVLLTVYLSAAACLECRKNRSLWIELLPVKRTEKKYKIFPASS